MCVCVCVCVTWTFSSERKTEVMCCQATGQVYKECGLNPCTPGDFSLFDHTLWDAHLQTHTHTNTHTHTDKEGIRNNLEFSILPEDTSVSSQREPGIEPTTVINRQPTLPPVCVNVCLSVNLCEGLQSHSSCHSDWSCQSPEPENTLTQIWGHTHTHTQRSK